MKQPSRNGLVSASMLSFLFVAGPAQANSTPCDEAWAAYNEFKSRTTMDDAQYPLTVHGAAVRAACGKEALPAPPGADVNPVRPHVRKKTSPPKPVKPPRPPRPTQPAKPLDEPKAP